MHGAVGTSEALPAVGLPRPPCMAMAHKPRVSNHPEDGGTTGCIEDRRDVEGSECVAGRVVRKLACGSRWVHCFAQLAPHQR